MKLGLKMNRRFMVLHALLGAVCAFVLLGAVPAQAATGINQTINFQGRLLNSQGATVADGFYNMQFKIYQDGDGLTVGDTTGSPAGSLKWTENYLNSASHGVKVVNGFLSVNLGSVTPFGSSVDWNQDTLWLSMQVGNTSSCTITTSFQTDCGGDGEMVPMQRMTATPYALNSGKLGGMTSSQFVQLAQGLQTDATSSTNSIYINKTGTGKVIDLQAGGNDVLAIDSTGNVVSIGITGSTAVNSTIHIADSSAGVQTVTIGSTNSSSATTIQAGSGGISLNGNTSVAGANTFGTGTGNVSLNGNTTVANDKSFTAGGTALFKDNTNSQTAFQIQNQAGNSNLLVADTINTKIGIGVAPSTSGGILQIGTDTTTTAGGAQFGTAIHLYRSNTSQLTTDASFIASNLQSGGDITIASTAMNAGNISKTYTVGASGVNTFDVVVMTTVPDVQQTTLARDASVLGVSKTTAAAAASATIVSSGPYRVNVDVGAVNIGDQLVTSTNAGMATVDNSATTGIVGIALSSKAGGANGTVSVLVRPIGGRYTPTFRAASTSTAAFQIQNNSGVNFFSIDTSGNNVNIGATGATSTSTNIHIADSSAGIQTVTVGSTNSTSTTNIQSGTNGIHLYGNTTVEGATTFNTGTGTVGLNGDTTIASGKNFLQNGGGTFGTGSGAVSLNGATSVTGTNTFNVAGGNTTLGANLDVTGSVAYKKGTDFSTTGATNDAALANASFVRLTGATAQTITGIANGRDGYTLTLVNAGTASATITNNDAASLAANRILTGTGTNLLIPVGGSVTLIYDTGGSLWHVSGITTNTLQAAYNVSTSPQITLAASQGGLVVQDASTPIGASLFTVQSNGGGTKYLDVNATAVAITDNLTVSGTYNTNTFSSTQLQFGGASGTVASSSGNLTIQAAGTNVLFLDTGGAGTVDMAITNATTVNMATNDTAHTIHIADGGSVTAQTVSIGSVSTTSATTIRAGSGGITLTGNTTVSGSNAFATGSGNVSLNGNTTLASGMNFLQNGAGTFGTGSGAVSLNGNTTLASGMNFTQNGTGSFTTGTGAVSLNGATTVKTTSTTAFQVQNGSSAAVLVVDTSNRQLKVMENAGSTNFALIYYDTTTSTANYTASAGTVAVGTGAGAINVTAGTGAAVSITANAASVWRTTAGSLTLQSGGGTSDVILNPGSSIVNVNGASVVKLGQSAGDPATCTAGAIVYNTSTAKLRGCQGSTLAWTDLGTITPTSQSVYTASTGGTTPEIKLDSTRGGFDIQDADSTIGGVLFAVRGSNISTLGTSLFNVNSSNTSVNVGTSVGHSTSAIILVLDNYSNGGADPTGVVGAMYYNGTNGKFRCYDGTWRDCMTGYNEISKTADQAATQNTTTMQNDSKLLFPMAATTNYVFDAYIPIDDSNTSVYGDYTFTVPSGAVLNVATTSYGGTGANATCNIVTSGNVCHLSVGNGSAANFIQVRGFVRNGSTSGNLQFQFTQSTAGLFSFPVVKAGAVLSWRNAN